MKINRKLYCKLLSVFAYNGREKGGLVFLLENRIVSYFSDETGVCTESAYRPDVSSLRRAIKSGAEKGYTEFAFIHCHPDHEPISSADIEWLRSFLRLNKLDDIKMFLVQNDRVICYLINSCTYEIIPIFIDDSSEDICSCH